ncbi:MAG: hypothetical protein MZV63_06720 [Marinilabiliales bacterium]|nr:hypothetical protein [Marinilabiliales bacterium]
MDVVNDRARSLKAEFARGEIQPGGDAQTIVGGERSVLAFGEDPIGNPEDLFVGVARQFVPLLPADRVDLRRRSGGGEREGDRVVGFVVVETFEHAPIERFGADQCVLESHRAFLLIEDTLVHPRTSVNVEDDKIVFLVRAVPGLPFHPRPCGEYPSVSLPATCRASEISM